MAAINNVVVPTVTASSATFSQLQAGGLSGIRDLLVTANAAISAPSAQLTVSPTGGGSSGGALPAGTYQLAIAFRGRGGFTTIGTSRSATFTVSSGNIPRSAMPSLPTGCDSIWAYLTNTSDPSGTLYLYATGVPTGNFDMSVAEWSDPLATVPSANDTGATNLDELIRSLQRGGNLELTAEESSNRISRWLSGDPVSRNEQRIASYKRSWATRFWATAHQEIDALQLANPGTLAFAAYGTMGKTSRSWP